MWPEVQSRAGDSKTVSLVAAIAAPRKLGNELTTFSRYMNAFKGKQMKTKQITINTQIKTNFNYSALCAKLQYKVLNTTQ
jgi:hypothetical protein